MIVIGSITYLHEDDNYAVEYFVDGYRDIYPIIYHEMPTVEYVQPILEDIEDELFELAIRTHNEWFLDKGVVASDFIIASPTIPEDPEEALDYANANMQGKYKSLGVGIQGIIKYSHDKKEKDKVKKAKVKDIAKGKNVKDMTDKEKDDLLQALLDAMIEDNKK